MILIPVSVPHVPRRTAWLCHVVAAVLTLRMVAGYFFPELDDRPFDLVVDAFAKSGVGEGLLALGNDLIFPPRRLPNILLVGMLMVHGPPLEDRLGAAALGAWLMIGALLPVLLSISGVVGLPAGYDPWMGALLAFTGLSLWHLRDDEVSVFYVLPLLPPRAGRTATHIAFIALAVLLVSVISMVANRGSAPVVGAGAGPVGKIGYVTWTILYPFLAAAAAYGIDFVQSRGADSPVSAAPPPPPAPQAPRRA